VTLLSPLGPNVGALATVCSVDDYNADKCPDTSKVGAATAITPLLPTPLTGPVRIVDVPGSLPKLVVYLNGLINLRLTGTIQLAALGTETTFAGIPDVPLSRFKLDFFSGPNGLVGTTGDICKSGVGIKGEFTAHSGKTVTVTSPASVEGCPAGVLPPGNARPLASVALRRLAGKSPLLSVSAKQRASGQPLRSVDVFLPSGLSFDRGTLSAGVKATKGVTASLRGKGVLQLRSTVPAARIGAVVKGGALRVSAGLRRRLGKSPKLTVVLRATDAGGKAYTLKKRVTARR
jgi:hypothetical protein